MSSNAPDTADAQAPAHATSPRRALPRRLTGALTVLAFIAIGAVAIYALSLIWQAAVLLLLSALLAYFIYPLTRLLQRRLKRPLAITAAYLLVTGALAVVMFIVISSVMRQVSSLAQTINFLLSPAGERQLQPIIGFLGKLGISKSQVAAIQNQLLSQALVALSGLLPFLASVFNNVINLIIVITLSVYFILDSPRIVGWLSHKTPANQRDTINFLLHTLDASLSGYFRGTALIALVGAVCTGAALALLRVPYAALLGALFFLLYFVPVIGTFIIAALCILAALPQGWVVMLIVAVFMVLLMGVVLGQVLAPRIFSKTVGVHPIIALFALFAGAELFGLLGGLLAIPVAGVLQQIIVALWKRWKSRHPDQFPPEGSPPQQAVLLPGERVTSADAPDPGVGSRQ
jgi:predicted PurR-regulated permease PerM